MANGNGYDSQVTVGLVVDDSQLSKVRWPGDYTVKIKQEIDSKGLDKAAFLPNYTQTITQTVVQDASWRKAYFVGDRVATTHLRLDNSAYLQALNNTPTGNFNFTANGVMHMKGQEEVWAAMRLLSNLPSEYYVEGQFHGKEVKAGLAELGNECKSLESILARLNTYSIGGDKTAKNMLGALKDALNVNGIVGDVNSKLEQMKASMTGKQWNQFSKNANFKELQTFLTEGVGVHKSGDVEAKYGWMTRWQSEMSKVFNQVNRDANNVITGKFGNYSNAASYQRGLTEYENKINKVREAYKSVQEVAANGGGLNAIRKAMEDAEKACAPLIKRIEKLENSLGIKKGNRYHNAENRDLQEAIALYEKYALAKEKYEAKMASVGIRSSRRSEMVVPISNQMQNILNAIGTGNIRDFLNEKKYKAVTDRVAADVNRATKDAANGIGKLRGQAEHLMQMSQGKLAGLIPLKDAGVATAAQTKAIDDITAAVNRLQAAMKGSNKAEIIDSIRNLSQVSRSSTAAIDAETKLRNAQARAARANNEAASEYIKKLDAMAQGHSNNYSLVSQLGQEIAAVYSIQQVRQFLTNIVQIGGQFEYQRKAIGNILGDVTKANTLFNQIKSLALHSPFSTLQLDQYAKELSAFEVPYNQLYDKLKKLADISAGTGTDMSRIILAYGHVQASGYLEGMQRRQFTNANINIIKALQELYAARGQSDLTPKDIYKRISNKQVTAQDLDEALMKMASPGGMFYNMQEEMADTTKATWKNVGDAINHMYMDLEQSNRGFLKGAGQTAMVLLNNVKNLIPYVQNFAKVLLYVLPAYKALRALSVAYMTEEERHLMTSGTGYARKNVYLANLAARYRQLTAAEKAQTAAYYASNKAWYQQLGVFTMMDKYTAQALVTEGRLTKEQIQQQVYTGRLNAGDAARLRTKEGILMFSRKETLEMMKQQKGVGVLAMGWRRIALGAQTAFLKVGAMAMSFASALAPVLLIGAGISLWTKHQEKANERAERFRQANEATASSVDALMKKNEEFKDIDFGGQTKAQNFEHIEDMSTAIKDNLAGADNILRSILGQGSPNFLEGEQMQAEALRNVLKDAEEAQKKLMQQGLGAAGTNVAQGISGFEDHLKDYTKSIDDFDKAVTKAMAGPLVFQDVENALKTVREKNGEFAADALNKNVPEQLQALARHSDAMNLFVETLKKSGNYIIKEQSVNGEVSKTNPVMGGLIDALGNLKNTSDTFDGDLKTYSTSLGSVIKNAGLDVTGATTDGTIAFRNQTETMLKGMNVDERHIQAILDNTDAINNWHIDGIVQTTPDDTLAAQIAEKYKKLGVSKDTKTAVDAIKAVRSAYDAAVSGKNELKNTKGGKSAQRIKEELEGYEATIKEAQDAAKEFGFSLEDPNKKTGKKHGDTTDKALKNWKAQMDAVDKLQNMYDKWYQVYGDNAAEMLKGDEAWEKVIAGLPADFDKAKASVRDYWDEYRKGKIKAGIPADKNADKDGRESALASALGKVNDDVLAKNKEKIARIVNDIERELDKRKNRINIYQKIFDATGNDALAAGFAFGKDIFTDLGKLDVWDDTEWILEGFKDKMKALSKSYGKEYAYEVLLGMTPEQMAEVPDEVKKAFDATRKEIESAEQKQLDQMASVMSNYQNIYQKLMAQRTKIAREKALIDVMVTKGMIDGNYADQLKKQMDAQQTLAELRETLSYSQYMSNVLAMTTENADKIGNALRNSLRDAFVEGTISAQQYAEELQKIHDVQTKLETESTKDYGRRIAAFMTQGKRGLRNARGYEGYEAERFRLQQEADKAQRAYDEAKLAGEDASSLESLRQAAELAAKQLEDFTAKVNWFDKWQDGLKDANKWLGAMTGVVEGLSGAFKEVSDVFYSYGNKKMGNMFSNIADGVDVFGSMLSPVSNIVQSAMSGDIGGVLKNAIMAPVALITGPIKAINALHDKRKQQQIDEQNESLKDLVSTYKELQRITQYGFGIQSDEWEEQRKNLEKQRDAQKEMLKLEKEKKNSDPDAVRGYEEAVKELDDQLARFTEELYKSLYGIDFKAWSKQLSDAIWSAFESGNDAAIAWEKSVGDIIRNVASQWMTLKFIEPVMEELKKKYLGEKNDKGEYEGGIWKTAEDMTEDTIRQLGNDLSQAYSKVNIASGVLNDYINNAFPYSSNDNSASGASKIGQNITEDTGSLISSYMNSIHYDTSAMRTIADKQLSNLNAIAENTKAIHSILSGLTTDGGALKLNVRM